MNALQCSVNGLVTVLLWLGTGARGYALWMMATLK